MLVGGVVVHDGVDHLAGRHGVLDCVQEGDELLMTVALAQRPKTVPSNVFSAANNVVVPLRTTVELRTTSSRYLTRRSLETVVREWLIEPSNSTPLNMLR